MLALQQIDLARDQSARLYVKSEVVEVVFASATGELISREGPNRYDPGDALVTGSTGDRWSVTRDRFDQKYEAVPPTVSGQDGHYKARPLPVLARQIAEAFSIPRRQGGDVLRGKAGDWLMQYAPGDFGIVDSDRFAKVYKPHDKA